MTIREADRRARQRERDLQAPNPYRVRSFYEWCELNGFSEATGRRILASGKGPKVLQLSARRIGIRDGDNLAWQNSLVRAPSDGR